MLHTYCRSHYIKLDADIHVYLLYYIMGRDLTKFDCFAAQNKFLRQILWQLMWFFSVDAIFFICSIGSHKTQRKVR